MPQGKGTYGSKVGRPPKKKPIKKLAKGDALSMKRRKRMQDPRVRNSAKGMSLREKLRLLEMMEAGGMDMKGIKGGGLMKKGGGGKLKSVPSSKKGLSKLPTEVRNKMGFMKKGGSVKKKMKKK
tara:strand:- start:271 stop:642 length:372 start_codon:yes stop_codon:yes gene_type:complete